MELFDHIKHDLQCLDHDATIQCRPNNFLMVSKSEANLQGAYLYYDMNNEVWIHSGKVTGHGFRVRHNEHKSQAKEDRTTSKFYS